LVIFAKLHFTPLAASEVTKAVNSAQGGAEASRQTFLVAMPRPPSESVAEMSPMGFSTSTAWLDTAAWTGIGAAPPEPYVLVDILADQGQSSRVKPRGAGSEQLVPNTALYPTNDATTPDMVMLLNFSEATILANMITRYDEQLPYTYTGEILTSINPCKRIDGIYSAETMTSYAGQLIGGNRPPHLYAMAEEAYRQLIKTWKHQGMVVSGVSGAGKTEANKIIMQYLCWRASHSAGKIGRYMKLSAEALEAAKSLESGDLEGLDDLPRRIMSSNQIFEAFGNSCTTNNHNSSRFGKFVRLLFDQGGAVIGANISTYLLEKSRLVLQCKDERNFHILYQLLAGGGSDPAAEGSNLHLDTPDTFHYLSQSGRITIDNVDDAQQWSETAEALEALGVYQMERLQLMSVLSGILQLGQLRFTDKGGTSDGSSISKDKDVKEGLKKLCELWGITERVAESSLTTRQMVRCLRSAWPHARPLRPLRPHSSPRSYPHFFVRAHTHTHTRTHARTRTRTHAHTTHAHMSGTHTHMSGTHRPPPPPSPSLLSTRRRRAHAARRTRSDSPLLRLPRRATRSPRLSMRRPSSGSPPI
jgi:myosin heavy subunit